MDDEKIRLTMKLMSKLSEGELSEEEHGWKTLEDAKNVFEY